MSRTYGKLLRTVLCVALLGVSLYANRHFAYEEKHPPATPSARTLAAYAPPRAEVRTPDQVRAIYYVRNAEVGPFQILVSVDQFRDLAAASQYTALVSHDDELIGNDFAIHYDYWLSRGDGAWYHATSALRTPSSASGFYWEFHQQDEFTWIAQPRYAGVELITALSWFLLLASAVWLMGIVLSCRVYPLNPNLPGAWRWTT